MGVDEVKDIADGCEKDDGTSPIRIEALCPCGHIVDNTQESNTSESGFCSGDVVTITVRATTPCQPLLYASFVNTHRHPTCYRKNFFSHSLLDNNCFEQVLARIYSYSCTNTRSHTIANSFRGSSLLVPQNLMASKEC